MSTPGWYPDPAGEPGEFRYWDGQSWAPTTSPSPAGVPLDTRPERRSTPWLIGGAILVLTVALIWWLLSGGGGGGVPIVEDTNSSSPTISAWDEKKPTSAPPVEAPSNGTLVDCPQTSTGSANREPVNGWIMGGGMKYQAVPGWSVSEMPLPWMHDDTSQVDEVYSGTMTGWISNTTIGALDIGDGFTDPKTATFQVLSCFATSVYYTGYTGREDLLSEEFNVGGHTGWHLKSAIYVNISDLPQVEGDWVDIVVVDLGEPESFAVFMSSVTIDDTARMKLVDAAIASLSVA